MKLLRFLLKPCHNNSHGRIKVMMNNGMCRNYEAPIFVKEILVAFPGYGVFPSEAVRKQGLIRANPLPGAMAMEPGRLYFLLPLPASQKPNFITTSTTERKGKRVSFATDSSLPSRASVQVLSSDQEGITRLKLVVPRQQLKALMNESGGDAFSIIENLVHPLLARNEMRSGSFTAAERTAEARMTHYKR